jgi:ferredoxin
MEASPTVFGWDENSLVSVLKETPEPSEEDSVRDAIANCPSGAIWLA